MKRKPLDGESKAFVDSMGHQMDYYHLAQRIAIFMVLGGLMPRESGAPKSFVVNEDGRLGWIG